MENVKTLRSGIRVTSSEPVPLVIHVAIQRGGDMIVGGGTPMIQERIEPYVNVTQLPVELQERIKTAINSLARV